MNNPRKFPIGALLYWVSLALCALVVSPNGFSFAGNGYSVKESTPCLVTNANCPKCTELAIDEKAYYNMAGITVFRTHINTSGNFHFNGKDYIPCYKYAICKNITWYVDYKCNLETGCVSGGSTTGCKDLEQQNWLTNYMYREKWVEKTEE